MNEEILLNYILKLVEYYKTINKCINLGCTSDEIIKTKIELSEESEKYIKNIMKERKIKKWN